MRVPGYFCARGLALVGSNDIRSPGTGSARSRCQAAPPPRRERRLSIPIRRSIEIAPHPRVRAGNGQCRETCMANRDIRAALNEHWAASDANDFELEHQIYREHAVLEYPQS